jgi:hypothetical protein
MHWTVLKDDLIDALVHAVAENQVFLDRLFQLRQEDVVNALLGPISYINQSIVNKFRLEFTDKDFIEVD